MDSSLSRILDPIPAMLRKNPSRLAKSYHKETNDALAQNRESDSAMKPVEFDQSFNPRDIPARAQEHANRGPFDIEERNFKAVEPLREFVDGRWQKRKLLLKLSMGGITLISERDSTELEHHPWHTIKKLRYKGDSLTLVWRDSGSSFIRESDFESDECEDIYDAFVSFVQSRKLNREAAATVSSLA